MRHHQSNTKIYEKIRKKFTENFKKLYTVLGVFDKKGIAFSASYPILFDGLVIAPIIVRGATIRKEMRAMTANESKEVRLHPPPPHEAENQALPRDKERAKRAVVLRRPEDVSPPNDHFKEDEEGRYAGPHLIVDLVEVAFDILNDGKRIRKAMRKAAKDAGATVLKTYVHPFQPQGIAAVVVLAESHMTIHTWPENGAAAMDIFMCGNADPQVALQVFCKELGITPDSVKSQKFRRLPQP